LIQSEIQRLQRRNHMIREEVRTLVDKGFHYSAEAFEAEYRFNERMIAEWGRLASMQVALSFPSRFPVRLNPSPLVNDLAS
jgi:hypothetical protein